MKALRFASLLAVFACLSLAACSRDDPVAPGRHSITGHTKLTGFLVNADARFAGTRVVGDADDIVVELASGSRIVGRTRTVDGVYRFFGLGPGTYVARSHVIGRIADTTEVMTISTFDIAAADTLRLTSRGDLYPVPNPIGEKTSVYYEIPDTQSVEITIVDLAGNLVRTLFRGVRPAGLNAVYWDGLDRTGQPTTAALYWITFVSGADIRAQLLFR